MAFRPDGSFGVVERGVHVGRSAYVCPDLACVDAAMKRGGVERTLRLRFESAVKEALWNELKCKLR